MDSHFHLNLQGQVLWSERILIDDIVTGQTYIVYFDNTSESFLVSLIGFVAQMLPSQKLPQM